MLLLVVLAIVCILLYKFLENTDEPTDQQAVITREYAPADMNIDRVFDHPEFSMKLPSDWVLREHETTPHNKYSYQATAKNIDNRWLEIYVNNVPTDKAFNRLRPVTVLGDRLSAQGVVSDNCYDTAQNKSVTAQSYQGVVYKCETETKTRNVVGVGAPGQGTTIKLGNRKFVIVYTDHNAHPDYQILDSMIESLRAK